MATGQRDGQRDGPSIAALFLIVFDQKVGYTIAWHRAVPDLAIDGVEYQSLPSGLHAREEDLVYFIHGDHAGVSAFARRDSDEAHRNAEFVSVGVLLPLNHGRLGRGWLLSDSLRGLAKEVVKDVKQTDRLEEVWEISRRREKETSISVALQASSRQDSVAEELERRTKSRRRSVLPPGVPDEQDLSPDHPALTAPVLLDEFGPLIFPIHRASLLRKRILFVGGRSVQSSCNVVYVFSVIAGIPDSSSTDTPPVAEDLSRIQPLFSVGIHDIPALERRNTDDGWLACTTDDIFRDKTNLYDLLVEFPSAAGHPGKQWPRLRASDGTPITATQRDLRRYKLLRLELRRMRLERQMYFSETSTGVQTPSHIDTEEDLETLLQRTTSVHNTAFSASDEHAAMAEIVEPVTWTALAYTSVMWWSAGSEMESVEHAEIEADRSLLDDLPEMDVHIPDDVDSVEEQELARRHQAQATATIFVAYFQRLTTKMLRVMADVIADAAAADDPASSESDADGGEEDRPIIVVNVETMMNIGLDHWSLRDKTFMHDAMKFYFHREAVVDEVNVRICGLRLC